eukprot:gene10849-12637_t
MGGLKRGSAPSAIFLQKKQKIEGKLNDEELEALEEEATTTTTTTTTAKGPGRKKKEIEVPKVNHLERYTQVIKPIIAPEQEAANNKALLENVETRKGRNVPMTATSPPLYYLINFRNPTKLEAEEVGILEVTYDSLVVISMEGKQVGRTGITRMSPTDDSDEEGKRLGNKNQKVLIKKKEVYVQEDFSMAIGNKIVKIVVSVTEEEYKNGSIFLKTDQIIARKKVEAEEKARVVKFRLAAAAKPRGFVVPLNGVEKIKKLTKPLHNPYSPNALVLYTPKDMMSGDIPVVVDPMLSAKLRPHQREGVQFLFDCLLGLRGGYKGNGCILADDMGLGKTIQAITILWTLLRQGPKGEPTARKAMIVAPSSLVGNWVKELKKWLGDAVQAVAIGESTKKGLALLAGLETGPKDVLVISYDQLRIWCEDICKITTIGLIICDEGHRLKNSEIKTTKAVAMMPTARRVILSGTPIQNDLNEFYAMVNFVNPGLLKSVATFKNVYDAPILASRSPDATEEQKALGRERSLEYLPKKIEYTVFIKLSPLQTKLYKYLLGTIKNKFSSFTGALPLITTLKKLSNCPELIYLPDAEEPTDAVAGESIKALFPKEFDPMKFQPQYSGKLQFLEILLEEIRNRPTKDRCVIISNYTQTLTVLARFCKLKKYCYFQLDGSTQNSKRQELVDLFNDPSRPEFIFLLSSKAGGVGLNLIGANHLVLFDPDWNPANDAQAMARVWREGQKKVVSIYRTLSTGTIEEKIFQRQITKMALSTSVVEGDSDNAPAFETKDLKDIFNLREDTICDTHDMLGPCQCGAPTSRVPKHKRDSMAIGELSKYDHYHDLSKLPDRLLAKASKDIVTFIFANDKPPVVKEKKKAKSLDDEADEVYVDEMPSSSSSRSSSNSSSSSKSSKADVEEDDEDETMGGFVVKDGDDDESSSSDESYCSSDSE